MPVMFSCAEPTCDQHVAYERVDTYFFIGRRQRPRRLFGQVKTVYLVCPRGHRLPYKVG